MIDRNFYFAETQKLIEQFGQKSFSGRKLDLIYNAIKRLDDVELASIVDDIIGNSKFTPTLDDFRDRAKRYLISKAKDAPVECYTCDSTGIVNVRKKTGEIGEYGFSCTCLNGEQFPALGKWKESYKKYFTKQIVSIELVNKFYNKENIQDNKSNFADEMKGLQEKYNLEV